MSENIFGVLIFLFLVVIIIFFYFKNKKEGKDNYSDNCDLLLFHLVLVIRFLWIQISLKQSLRLLEWQL